LRHFGNAGVQNPNGIIMAGLSSLQK